MALLLTIAAIYALVRLAGRVYAGALLHTGGKVRLGDAWRAGGADIPAKPVTAVPAQVAAGEGSDLDRRQRHPEPEQDKTGVGAAP